MLPIWPAWTELARCIASSWLRPVTLASGGGIVNTVYASADPAVAPPVGAAGTPFLSNTDYYVEYISGSGQPAVQPERLFEGFYLDGNGTLEQSYWGHLFVPPFQAGTASAGWSHFTHVIDANPGSYPIVDTPPPVPQTHFLYGLNANGRLYRYALYLDYSATGHLAADGSVAGFSDLRGIELIAHSSTRDVLLASRASGALIEITLPNKIPLTAAVTTIRRSGWQNFDGLVASPCGCGTFLVGWERSTGHAFVYSVGHLAGTATEIISFGLSPLPAKFTAVASYNAARNTEPSQPAGA